MNMLSPSSPIVKLSLVLAIMSCGLLVLSEMLGISQQGYQSELTARKKVAETLAIQVSSAVENRTFGTLDSTILALVERDKDIHSIGLRRHNGALVSNAGDHNEHWHLDANNVSTVTQVRIPMFNRDVRWGDLEIAFYPIKTRSIGAGLPFSYLWVLVFMIIGGFTSNLIFLRRALKDLDPNAVVPQRVSSALDVLAEGLVVIDTDERILLANAAFCRKTARRSEHLVGVALSSLNWTSADGSDKPVRLPWYPILSGQELSEDTQIKLVLASNESYTFSIHAVPVTTAEDKIRGAIVTFDDLTHVESANSELRSTLGKLEVIREDMAKQNSELYVLATRDSLSNALNRRALFEAFDQLFTDAHASQDEMCCIMTDIDKFKLINDRFGHGVGDQVIKGVSEILNDKSRASDIVGRYGGEEFCIVLPSTSLDQAMKVAENIRQSIQDSLGTNFDPPMEITASFGVSSSLNNAVDPLDLCNQADQALYVAKKSGRNTVVAWPSVALFDENIAVKEKTSGDAVSAANDDFNNDVVVATTTKESDLLAKIEQLEEDLIKSQRARAGLMSNTSGNSLHDRKILHDRLDQSLVRARRSKTKVAVMVIEFAAYRDVNAVHGIGYSEKLIEAVHQRIGSNLRDTDTVSLIQEDENTSENDLFLARSSDDKIVLVLVDLHEDDALVRLVDRIQLSISQVFHIDGKEFHVTPCIGLAVAPVDGEDSIRLMANAHAALDHAKRTSDDVIYRFYASDMNDTARSVLNLQSELHRAIEQQEFVLHYQPRIDCASGDICGFEALIRWEHPTKGLLMPDSFIALAEKARLIERMGEWVIATACQQLAEWTEFGHKSLEISVNVSPLQMRNNRILDVLKTQIADAGLGSKRIEIEITESVILDNVEKVIPLMQQIVDAGVSISLDDFGTGYSCLSYLKELPLQRLKVDRSFIAGLGDNIDDYAIVSAVIEMAHAMNMQTVVEGVEEAEQWQVLRDLGCDELQGYYLGRPGSAQDALNLLSPHSSLRPKLRLIQGSRSQDPSRIERAAMAGIINDATVCDLRKV